MKYRNAKRQTSKYQPRGIIRWRIAFRGRIWLIFLRQARLVWRHDYWISLVCIRGHRDMIHTRLRRLAVRIFESHSLTPSRNLQRLQGAGLIADPFRFFTALNRKLMGDRRTLTTAFTRDR